jgi:hypothetical protein
MLSPAGKRSIIKEKTKYLAAGGIACIYSISKYLNITSNEKSAIQNISIKI